MGSSSTNLAMTDLTPKNQFTNLTKPLGPFNPVALLHHSITEMYQCFFVCLFFILFYFIFILFASFHFASCAD